MSDKDDIINRLVQKVQKLRDALFFYKYALLL